MARSLATTLASQLDAKELKPFYALEFGFDSGALYLWTGLGDLVADGETWVGGAGVIGISTSSETVDLSANNVTITLNGLDSAVLAIALAEPYRGRPFTLYLGALDSENQSVGTMYQLFSGRMDTMSVEDNGSTANISLVIENALVDLERPRIRRLTNEEQLARFPGDQSLSGVAKLQDRQISWGRA